MRRVLARLGLTKHRRSTVDDYLRTVLSEHEWKNQAGVAKRLPSSEPPSAS